ncbi:ATPases involved in chromosome partitioning [Clostridium pasteurianum DSM 525 = ATCC 6013]|uniref:ATPases involved in chromosome partitioning n=1 Tax=Clostridium pasteurianum DSM 525 = ATCC 6013 TaxID=1262449 RepID=A0A0H3J4L6_CLOPA|nr:MinD/ParA family protein [Clostridium pasteurianum]AJA47902.1 ATPases involved in chromosome partitioning [Clostridium pasteurianum DSM 525 = ATCC 6013]AJA51890.1 ATPases involved in chromosome partitioning [Clostridium pasteurianum DSM 525 = ATCC 6013]AOZ75192.1 chromosome partitioning protein ParA [Clostridium pasteurianum DSM 525 = ATCC 6013]AOZ78987.1 chromosome partitioning protein ParA [Clostridium pasteurianum]ELP59805.1 MinD family ATPase [Clostridium pasteurianum DSM 525 = ATCC 601
MLDQAQRLRQMAAKEGNMNKSQTAPKIITVTSGKGGVGKSNFVVNLSITLQKMGKKVLIFDADVGMGNDDVLMGFLPKYNVFDVIFNNKNIEDVIIEGPFGVKLLPGGSGVARINEITNTQRNNFLNKLSQLENLDYIIMDTGAGISRSVLGFVSCCDELFLIITPEPTSLMDSYSLLKAVVHFKIKDQIKIIVNRTYDSEEAEETYNKFANAVNNFLKIHISYMGNISEDRKLVSAVRNQEPFVIGSPNSSASQDLLKIANKILGDSEGYYKSNEAGIQGLFKKIFNIFS